MPTIHLRLLGPVQIARGAAAIPITSPKIIALLAYLALEPDRAHTREHLAELLWPGQSTGRQNLRKSISRLQAAMAQAPDEPPLLLVTRRDIALNPAADLGVDATNFLAGLAHARDHGHPELLACPACLQRLIAAVACYQGDLLDGLFVDSAPLEAWLLARRTWLQQEALWALDALADSALGQGDAQQALAFARRQLALDPLREEAHRQVMEAHILNGQPREAQTHYHHLVHLLSAELDAAPAAEITDLVESLQRAGGRPDNRRRSGPASTPPNLPHQFTLFVGRDELLTLVQERLCQDACRLLTLAGPGGVGKTRLAVEAARYRASAFPDGVHFVDLAPLDDPAQLPAAVAAALGLVLPPQAWTLQEQQDALVHLLANREALLLLDNYEQLLPDVALVTRLLQETSRLHLLVTSRAPLNLRAEWIVDVDGLPVPPPDIGPETLTGECFPALALFEQAAGRVKHDFTPSPQERLVAAHICRLVQGAPLALELAAARVRDLPLDEIAAAIEQDLDFLSTAMADVPERHRSLRAVFDHSWQLLPPQQQAVFARLAVFRDPFTPEAAWQVAGASDDQLNELALHALLRSVEGGRLGLHPSLRQFAAEKLTAAPGAQAEIHRRHGHYYLAQLQKQGERLFSRDALAALAQLRQDVNNLRAAWGWAVSAEALPTLAKATDGAYRFFNALGLVQEGRQAMTSALTLLEERREEDDVRLLRAQLLAKLARFLNLQGLYEQADAAAGEAVALLSAGRALEDLGLAACAEALLQWGRAALHQGRYEEAEGRLEEAQGLVRFANAPSLEAEIHLNLGTIYNFQNAFDAANAHDEAALALARACGDLYTEGLALNNMGSVADFRGDYDTAAKCFEEALTVFDAVGYRRGSAAALSNLGAAEAWRGKLKKALACHQEALQAAKEMGDIDGEAWALMALGAVHTHLGRLDEARADLEAALVLNGQDGTRTLEAWCLHHLSQVALAAGNLEEADSLAAQAGELAAKLDDELTVAAAQLVQGEVTAAQGCLDQAAAGFQAALATNQKLAHAPGQLRVLAALSRLALAQGNPQRACELAQQALALEGTERLRLDRAPVLAVYGQALIALQDPRGEAILDDAWQLFRSMGQEHLISQMPSLLPGGGQN